MTCNPYDINGICPNESLTAFYQERSATGAECQYELYPPIPITSLTKLRFYTIIITGILIGIMIFIVIGYTIYHRYKMKYHQKIL
jgi:hypothetical protein